MVVHAALDDHVEFYGEAGVAGGVDAADDAFGGEALAVHAAESFRVEAVEGDVEAIESGGAESGREFFEEPAVGCEGDVGDAELGFDKADEVGNV